MLSGRLASAGARRRVNVSARPRCPACQKILREEESVSNPCTLPGSSAGRFAADAAAAPIAYWLVPLLAVPRRSKFLRLFKFRINLRRLFDERQALGFFWRY